MKLEKAFKAIIHIYLATLVAVFISVFTESEEVNQINENISSGFMGSNEATELAFGIMSLIFMVVFFISLYFIYKFKKSGKKLYTICFIIGSLLTLVSGPYAMGEISTFLYELNGAASGAILVFLYFTPLEKKFN
jgi:hypothetical protein